MIALISKNAQVPAARKEWEHCWTKAVAQTLAPDGALQVLAENDMGYCIDWASLSHLLTSISTSDKIQERE